MFDTRGAGQEKCKEKIFDSEKSLAFMQEKRRKKDLSGAREKGPSSSD